MAEFQETKSGEIVNIHTVADSLLTMKECGLDVVGVVQLLLDDAVDDANGADTALLAARLIDTYKLGIVSADEYDRLVNEGNSADDLKRTQQALLDVARNASNERASRVLEDSHSIPDVAV